MVRSCLGLVLVFAAGVVQSCDDEEQEEHERDYRRSPKTSMGFHVEFLDLGTLSSGLLSLSDVHGRFDIAFVRAAYLFEQRSGVPVHVFMAVPHDKKLVFVVHDHWHYYSPYNGWVSGEAMDVGTIHLSFWEKWFLGANAVPINPWTVDTERGVRYCGYNGGNMSELIAHEMGHVFFGHDYGH